MLEIVVIAVGACSLYLEAPKYCEAPRMEFTEFYTRACNSKYPGQSGELASSVQHRMADGVASYINYVVRYNDDCTHVAEKAK